MEKVHLSNRENDENVAEDDNRAEKEKEECPQVLVQQRVPWPESAHSGWHEFNNNISIKVQ